MAIEDNEQLTGAERNLLSKDKVPFFKFVLTGGPCGGKTTALARTHAFLTERGFEVMTAPEVFTILASNGMSGDIFSTEGMGTIVQNKVLDLQLTFEDSLETILRASGKPAVLLCDRGPMDGAAYLSEHDWGKIMESRGLDAVSLLDARYNAVLHMVTAADGAESYYTLENHASRTETPDEAIDLDKRTHRAWHEHPHMYVFDNSTDFEGKLQRLIRVVAKLVGLPSN